MRIPTKEEFAEYAQACRTFTESLIAISGYDVRAAHRVVTRDVFQERMRFLHGHFEVLISQIESLPASIWLKKQPTFERMISAVWGRKRQVFDIDAVIERQYGVASRIRTHDEFFGAQAQRPSLLRRFPTKAEQDAFVAKQNNADGVSGRLDSDIWKFVRHNPYDVEGAIAQAFLDYFYTDRARQLADEGKRQVEIATSVLGAIKVVQDAHERYEFISQRGAPGGTRGLDRLRKELEVFLAESEQSKPPVKRMDNTARERVLAYDIWRTFRRVFRSNKSKAIYYLLNFDGVQNPPDSRNLERWVADWTEEANRQLIQYKNASIPTEIKQHPIMN